MDEVSDDNGRGLGVALLRALRPAVPAVIGAAALTFLFAAVMPMAWVAGISWNLYLDRLADLFVPPVGNGARLALALGMAGTASLIAALVALLIAQREGAVMGSLGRRRARASHEDAEVLPRRRADFHPDDPPRPPIRAARDLPAEGLGPVPTTSQGEAASERWVVEADRDQENELGLIYATRAEYEEDELILDALAPMADPTGDEPWLQPAEIATAFLSGDASDKSLGAMVARFEAGLARRRGLPMSAAALPLTIDPANEDGAMEGGDPMGGEVDFALEAALGTLQRMNRQTVG